MNKLKLENKKLIFIVIVGILAVLAVFAYFYLKNDLANNNADSQVIEEGQTEVISFVYNTNEEPVSRRFPKADYDADIFEDKEYMQYTSWINYTNGIYTEGIYDNNYNRLDPNLPFFGKYFDSLKAGDTETLLSLHSDKYFENNWKWTKIAPQRVYDIYVEYIFDSDVNDLDYGAVTKYVYKLSYKILKNDGTFRNDIGSDASKPVYVEVVVDNNGNAFIDAQGNSFKYPEE